MRIPMTEPQRVLDEASRAADELRASVGGASVDTVPTPHGFEKRILDAGGRVVAVVSVRMGSTTAKIDIRRRGGGLAAWAKIVARALLLAMH